MTALEWIWSSLRGNAVLLIMLLPLLGAGLTLASARLGLAAIRRTAQTNALLTLGLAIVMVAHFEPQPETRSGFQMVSSLRWLGGAGAAGPDVRLTVGVDGISLWPIALAGLLMVPAVFRGADDAVRARVRRPDLFYALLLTLQSALVGTFAALDVILFVVCLELSLIAVFFLIGGWGGPQRRQAARAFFVWQLAGALLVFLGLAALVLAHRSALAAPRGSAAVFSIPVLIAELRPSLNAAGPRGDGVAPWIFFALTAGFALRVPLFPLHGWLRDAQRAAPAPVALLVTGLLLPTGLYGWLRFVLPVFPRVSAELAGPVSTLAVLGTVYGGLLSLGAKDLRHRLAGVSISQLGLCAAGLFSLNAVGMAGGLLLATAHGAAIGLVLFLARETPPTPARPSAAGLHPPARYLHRESALAFGLLALAGVPGLSGFAGEVLTLLGIFRERPVVAFWGLAGTLLAAWALLEMLLDRSAAPDEDERLDGTEAAVAAFMAAVLVWIGITPHFFLSRIEPAFGRWI